MLHDRTFTEHPDRMQSIYQHINFTNSIVAGSYALHQFTGDSSWEPNDVDILMNNLNFATFKTTVDKFCAATGGVLVKCNDFSKGHPADNEIENRRDEKFHEVIKASAKVQVPGIDIMIQFVFL
jgi:hypothetical protein